MKALFLLDFEFSFSDPVFCIIMAVAVLLIALLAVLLVLTFGRKGSGGRKAKKMADYVPASNHAASGGKCPSCGAPLDEDSVFCANCGAPVTPPVPAARPVDRMCPACGAPLDEDSAFCANCGAPVTAPAPAEEPAGGKCPVCGSPVDEDSAFCANCGAPIAAAHAAPAPYAPGSRRCPSCGTLCDDETLFCPSCGTPLSPGTPAPSAPAPHEELPKPNRLKPMRKGTAGRPADPAASSFFRPISDLDDTVGPPRIPTVEAAAGSKPSEEQGEVPESNDQRFCHVCGAELTENVPFCPACGTRVAE